MAPFLLVVLVLILFLTFRWYSRRHLPPGPPSLPILGCAPFTDWKFAVPNVFFDPKYNKYGDVVRFDFGQKSFYVLNDLELTKELFNLDAFQGRLSVWKYFRNLHCRPNQNAGGIIANTGQSWVNQRRFALKNLKEFGYGRKVLDVVIQEEAQQVLEEMLLDQSENGEVLIQNTFNIAVLNVLWQIVSSKRLTKGTETAYIMEQVNQMFEKKGVVGIGLVLPFIAKILPARMISPFMMSIMDMIRKEVVEHEENFDPNSPPKDFMEIYLAEIEKGLNEDFHREQLVSVCTDFFIAGSETTSTFLKWSMLFMAIHPEVQRQCQKEIDQILGQAKPGKDDQSRLVYVSATISEIFRLAHVAPGTLLHETLEDFKLRDFLIPKGSLFTANLLKFSMDPKTFTNPEIFNPERFIENGNLKVFKELAPFGIGKRICMGESLARTSAFIFFVMILQQLEIKPAPSRPKPDSKEKIMNFSTIPKPFYISVTNRTA